ncbi:hypothetical protein FKP32DRAFT_6001 [Trametes sanguinea]|nr:hypothetical protein FKP32DRAFT_6001 [Trametes sanguinea]
MPSRSILRFPPAVQRRRLVFRPASVCSSSSLARVHDAPAQVSAPGKLPRLSHSPRQRTLTDLVLWCTRNGLLIHIPKSVYIVFGPLPRVAPVLILHCQPLRFTETVTYVGSTLTSSAYDILRDHRVPKALKARQVANACLALESYIGPIPPTSTSLLSSSRRLRPPRARPREGITHIQYARRVFCLPTQTAPLSVLADLRL